MSTVNRRHKIFVSEMILHGDQAKAYSKAYPNASRATSEKNSYRLLQNATIKNRIEQGLTEKETAIKKARLEEIEKLAKDQVISEIQIDAKLSAIVMGSLIFKRTVVAFNKTTGQFHKAVIEEEPGPAEIIAAANLLYKRKGSYAERKIRHQVGDSFIEMLKELSKKKKSVGTLAATHPSKEEKPG